MKRFTFLFTIFLFACSSPEIKKKAIKERTIKIAQNDTSTKIPDFPTDFKCDLIETGWFHDGDLNLSKRNEKWLGLFFDGKNCFTRFTKIQTKRCYDEFMDDDSTKQTAWEISIKDKEENFFLLSETKELSERNVPFIKLEKSLFAPGESIEFDFLKNHYRIYATGKINKEEVEPIYENYCLIIEAKINGELRKSTLLKSEYWHFLDFNSTILFAGDIDGDQILDLYVNRSTEYFAYYPNLFLSRKIKGNELLQVVGEFVRSSC